MVRQLRAAGPEVGRKIARSAPRRMLARLPGAQVDAGQSAPGSVLAAPDRSPVGARGYFAGAAADGTAALLAITQAPDFLTRVLM
jgi:hypothetical protein